MQTRLNKRTYVSSFPEMLPLKINKYPIETQSEYNISTQQHYVWGCRWRAVFCHFLALMVCAIGGLQRCVLLKMCALLKEPLRRVTSIRFEDVLDRLSKTAA
eukprot:1238273-Amphidinium_carterae.1